jgi:adenylate cyclase
MHQSPIRLISIDAKTEANPTYRTLFGNSFSRRAAGYAIRFLNRTQPKAVILDVSFNGGDHPTDRDGDQFLVNSVKGNHPVISQLMFENLGPSAQRWEAQPKAVQQALLASTVQVEGLSNFPVYQNQNHYDSLVAPYTGLLYSGMHFYSATLGTFTTDLSGHFIDTQAKIRRWSVFSQYGGHIYPSLPLAVIARDQKDFTINREGELRWENQRLALGVDGSPLIKWYGQGVNPQQPVYPEYSFADVVLSELSLECQENPSAALCQQADLPRKPLVQPETFRNQFTLIGFVNPNFDTHSTIYRSQYPGFYIMANVLDNALHNDFVRPAPGWLNVLCLLGLPTLLGLSIYRFPSTLINLLVGICLAAGHFLLCLHAYYEWNIWIYAIYPILALALCFSGLYVYRYAKEHKQRLQMRYAFGKYVSSDVLKMIEQQAGQLSLGGERREMTFMFSDIRGFSTFSDQNNPEVVQVFLSQYFSSMNGIIMHQYRGSINKLIGDAIMAYWGFPLNHEDHAFLAVSAALAMQEAMQNWQTQKGQLPIQIGIGINTGEAMIGNIGSEDFMDFTVIGDAVNIASRLEGQNKTYGTTIIISAATCQKVRDRIKVRSLGWCELKGKSEPVEIFEPLGLLPSATP